MKKRKNKIIYILINIIIILIICYYLFKVDKKINIINPMYIIYAILPFLCIHIVRIIRQYIILMDNKLKLSNLTSAYLKSSLTNTIVPFKIGELFKIYLYGYEMDNYRKSFLGVIIDKCFDAVVLLVLFISTELFYHQPLSFITILLLIFVGLMVIIYISFENTYNFLNKYLIINKNSSLSIKCLKILEELKSIFSDVKNMIKDRIMLILVLTSLSWVLEIWFVSIISKMANMNSSFMDFINYMNSSFIGISNELSKYYILVTIVLFIIFIVGFLINKIIKES